ncbi:MAG: sigma-70 family RNA polymerase sigma factor [Ruminococcaceae bacterium]|nr:sigma-70 family RNA polymerase sigma factor [Oscillospiraceae bacterium]
MLLFYTLLIEEDNDKAKFEKIYALYKKKMWYTANSVLSDSYLAEDAVHNAFIGIAKNIKKIDAADSPKTLSYVITAAKNAALDILRKNKGLTEADIDELYDVSDKESSSFYQNLEAEDFVVKILAAMPETYRDVLYLLVVEQMSEKEIAELLGRKPGTIHQQVRRGRAILKEELMKGAKVNGNQ